MANTGFITVLVRLAVAVCFIQNIIATQFKTVETKDGFVLGRLSETFIERKSYFEFKGIPYAKPPIGDLRFKAPEPIDPWTPKIINASEYRNGCMQHSNTIDVSEDCLYLNVFVPVNSTDKFAVIIFIYGGIFVSGSAQHTGPNLILDENVILVTFNYRIGAFGFISMGTPVYSGNMGLKDQQLAFKWIYNNIAHFGGDNTRITIAGQSAGAFSAILHLFNNESRKYFNRIISMSGSMFHSYAKGNHKCIFNEIARNLSKTIDYDEELIDFLTKISAKQLVNYTIQSIFMEKAFNFPTWAPIIEEKDAIRPFITEDPNKLVKVMNFHNMEIYFTHTNREILMFETPESLGLANVKHAISTYEGVYVPLYAFDLAEIENIPLKSKPYLQKLLSELKRPYFTNVTNDDKTILRFADMQSDFVLNYYIDRSVQLFLSKTSAVFYSRFSIDSTLNVFKHQANIALPGASHADDICYVFWCYSVESLYKYILATKDTDSNSKTSFKAILHMTKLFSNFAKYGQPTINGDPVYGFKSVKSGQLNFVDVTNHGLTIGQSPSGNLMELVDHFQKEALELILKHGDLPKKDELNVMCKQFIKLNDGIQ